MDEKFEEAEALWQPKPLWREKKVDMDTLALRTIPIDREAIKDLGKAINALKDEPYSPRDIATIKIPKVFYPAVPVAASVFAHERNPEIPIRSLSLEEVQRMKPELDPWLKAAGWLIGKFSPNTKTRFENWVKKKGQQKVFDEVARSKIAEITRVLSGIEKPKEQFIAELTALYAELSKRETKLQEGFFGEEEVVVPAEEKILKFLRQLRSARFHPESFADTSKFLNDKDFPLLFLLPKLGIPTDPPHGGADVPAEVADNAFHKASIVGPELMQGIQTFLANRGVHVAPAPGPRDFDFFNGDSWMRLAGEVFMPEKLERIKKALPDILEHAVRVLPESGPELVDKIYSMAEDICVLDSQGKTPDEIAAFLLKGSSNSVN